MTPLVRKMYEYRELFAARANAGRMYQSARSRYRHKPPYRPLMAYEIRKARG